jgi:hypothetical protein
MWSCCSSDRVIIQFSHSGGHDARPADGTGGGTGRVIFRNMFLLVHRRGVSEKQR